ncbi:MAG: TetR family transcriptional regulator [Hyphomonas sp.]|nr:TetR family transcriptional regulator [Hyphomonas sp.]
MTKQLRTPVQARSEDRRNALIDAVVRLLAREGAKGVTHRAVAKEAGATHGTVRYYFESSDDMISAALQSFLDRQVSATMALHGQVQPGRGEQIWHLAAAYLANRLEYGREGEIARYEMFLHATRNDTVRPVLEEWAEAYLKLFETEYRARGLSDPRMRAERVMYILNGVMLRQLSTPMENFEKGVLLPLLLDAAKP